MKFELLGCVSASPLIDNKNKESEQKKHYMTRQDMKMLNYFQNRFYQTTGIEPGLNRELTACTSHKQCNPLF